MVSGRDRRSRGFAAGRAIVVLLPFGIVWHLTAPKTASFDPADEMVDKVQASLRGHASELVLDKTRRVKLDNLSVGSTLQASEIGGSCPNTLL